MPKAALVPAFSTYAIPERIWHVVKEYAMRIGVAQLASHP
jgi:hypothetical protein